MEDRLLIQDRVEDSVRFFALREFSRGLNAICPALEASARKYFKRESIGSAEFKSFIRNYYWIIERFAGCPDLFLTKFPSQIVKTDGGRILREPDLADIVYHFLRNAVAHGHNIQKGFEFLPSDHQNRSLWAIKIGGGQIDMPEQLAWALVAVVLFCEANRDIETLSASNLYWSGAPGAHNYTFDIDLFWGREQDFRKLIQNYEVIRVQLKFGENTN